MKKILLSIFVFTFGLSVLSNAQQKTTFTFVKSSILDLEKRAKYNDDGMNGDLFKTPILKKRMLGMFLIDDTTSSIDYNSAKYIAFLAIPSTDKFEMITDVEFGSNDWERNLFLRNIKTQQKYAIMSFPIRKFQDYANMGNDANGNGYLTKECPKELTKEEKELLSRYKLLIKDADANIAILLSIQKKYLTRGHFDEARVSSSDKVIYNRNMDELKDKAGKLADIDRYEDKNDKMQDRLTVSELGSLNNINNWNLNQYKLN
jgi:hypothetical protein